MVEKKITVKSIAVRRSMIDKFSHISQRRQCELLCIHRSGLYYKPVRDTAENLHLLRMMDEQYLKTPFYGKPRLTAWFRQGGYVINPKRVRRLMEIMNWQTLYRKPKTTRRNKQHPVYPYLLKDLKIERINQAWAIDITYVPMRRGFMYLCALIDLHSRYVVNWSISNTMTAEWCRSVVEEAIDRDGRPEIINSDQGSQFTAFEYTSLFDEDMKISMDGKGRAIDNIFIERLWKSVKYECVYLNVYEDGVQLYKGLQKYFTFYNTERIHQSLNYQTPEKLYYKAA